MSASKRLKITVHFSWFQEENVLDRIKVGFLFALHPFFFKLKH